MKKETKNYKSRYERNRNCYRKDKTTYIYSEYIDDGNGQGHYVDYEYHVGDMDEHGRAITLEMLDALMEFDNAEAQDTEDQDRNEELLVHNDFSDGDFVETGMSRIGTTGISKANGLNPSGAMQFNAEFIGPEAVLFGKKETDSISIKDFKEKVLPLLTEEQLNLIYERFGAGKTLEQIAKEQDKPVTKQAIDKRFKTIFKKVADNMRI